MHITPTIEIIDLALYIKPAKALVISDVHIGYEEALNRKGILIPRKQFPETMLRLEKIITTLKKEMKGKKEIKEIVINGDLKHEFGRISETEWRHALRIIDTLQKECKRITLIKGNHDTILKPIAEKRAHVQLVDQIQFNDILILHGDALPKEGIPKDISTIIIGHEHCAITLRQWPRAEKFKCFIKGKYKGKVIIAMPSFNLLHEGTDVLKEKCMSPFLQQNLGNFTVYVVSDKEVLEFGKLKSLR